MNLKKLTHKDSPLSRKFDFFIQGLVVISLITFPIETLPHLQPDFKHILNIFEIIIVIIFSLEYLIRLYTAEKKLSYVFSFYGIIDLLAIIPYYLASGIDLRTLKIIRILRLLRMLKFLRYKHVSNRFTTALALIKEDLIFFSVATLIILYLSAVGIYYFEHEAQPEAFKTVFHGLWWAVATLTSVGYGDVYPVTVWGKIFTFFILIIGMGIIAVPTGLFASALTKVREKDLKD
ncbi:MAG: ion transporter [Halobacteriovoraceae bacterium]|nr:ion transporter [Halobacteriovoraceae bacterium]